jgi:putative transposase
MSVYQKRMLITPSYRKLAVNKQCALLELPRSSYYFKPRGENLLNQFIMNKIDSKFTECPFYGVERMTDYINYRYGLGVNVKRIRRLYKLMALDTLMPKPGLSKKAKDAFIFPYLLNNLTIDRPNQVWQADITYVAMQRGFMYKFAIIDVYSRKILGWGTSNTMSVAWMMEVLESAIRKYGKPEIFNSDQGSQFTSLKFVSLLKNHKIKQSMDGKGRALDNVFIERYWRSYKYEYLFLNPPKDAWELFSETEKYVKFYNKERRHEALERLTPNEVYFNYRKLPNVS